MKSFKKILSTVLSALLLIGLFQVDIFKVTAITTTGAYNNLIYNLYDYETITIKDCVSNVEDIVIPNKINGHLVTTIGYQAFKDCTHLKSIVIPDSVTNIEPVAFSGCSSLESITISNSITSIGMHTFYGCSSLNSITIPNGVTSLGMYAFSGCTGLTSVTIPNSITTIESGAFYGCTGLTSITIPDGITSIGHHTFFDCSSLTNITIPDSVTSIDDSAFSGCTGLTSVTIPNSITTIESGAFHGCTGLTSITIPDSVTSIGSSAFSGCSSLAEVTLPFVGDKRYSIEDKETHPFGYIFGEANYSGSVETEQEYYDAEKKYTVFPKYYIPASLKTVAITDCDYIQFGAFRNCSTLTSITIPDDLEYIDSGAFLGCSELKDITIPNSVTTIKDGTFWGCRKLKSITIPDSVATVESCAFLNCTSLKTVYYGGTEIQKNQISIYNIDSCNTRITNAEWIYNCTAERAEKCETLRKVYLKTAIQKKSGAKPTDSSYNLRLISMLDGLNDYSEVGFCITIAGYNDGENDEPIRYSTDTVYTSFLNGGTRVKASDYGAEYFTIVNMTVPNEYYSANIKIKPYIVFTDGSEFSGNEINTTVSKYIK